MKYADLKNSFIEVQRIYQDFLKYIEFDKIDNIDRHIIKGFFDDNYPTYKNESRKIINSIPRYCIIYLLSKYTTIKDVNMMAFLGINKERSACSVARQEVEKKLSINEKSYQTIIDHFNLEFLTHEK
jgi:predicted ATP-dependent Lon-type protease